MSKVKQLLAQYSISSHSLALAFLFSVAAYHGVPSFHKDVLTVYGVMPGWLQELSIDVPALIAFYKTWKKTGATA